MIKYESACIACGPYSCGGLSLFAQHLWLRKRRPEHLPQGMKMVDVIQCHTICNDASICGYEEWGKTICASEAGPHCCTALPLAEGHTQEPQGGAAPP